MMAFGKLLRPRGGVLGVLGNRIVYGCGRERYRWFLRHKLYIIYLMLYKTEYYKRKLAL
jgi:hypothetical protein